MTFTEALFKFRFYLLLLIPILAVMYFDIVSHMIFQWANDENYSHGFLVPLISGFFVYQRWDKLRTAPVDPSNLGLIVVFIGLSQLILGWLGTELFNMRLSLVVILCGMTLYLFGLRIFKIMALPLLFLILMIPIPYIIYDAAAFPLKLFVTNISVTTLKMLGVIVWNEGNIIMFTNTVLEVADACSGLRSIMSLLALAVAFAFLTQKNNTKRAIIIASAIPIAVITNAMRVIVTGFLAQYWGPQVAQGFFHDFAGFAVFAVAMVLLLALGGILSIGPRER
ncbi:exosortase [Desulfonatronum thiosulfatophilum]|uniref:Exosortase n=1 Tax=Desulfonatronum thiosulfatophilum TaxID=617002 RepID=A0A1G6EKQ1_9BACT|nr:exosortase A [Desulfonatronum thiosulfatophilum]SDB57968.1 exosortase [Desulfonatronum thiosulfatophilum]